MCSEDKKVSYGFLSLCGKRVLMEDFFDVQILQVDGVMVGLFGVFDGQLILFDLKQVFVFMLVWVGFFEV